MTTMRKPTMRKIKPIEFIRQFAEVERGAYGASVCLSDKMSGMKVSIENTQNNLIALRLDGKVSHPSFWLETKGLWRVCDYVLVFPWDEKMKIVFVELKKSAGSLYGGVFQLAQSRPWGAYLRDVIEQCCESPEFHSEPLYLLIAHTHHAGNQSIKTPIKGAAIGTIDKRSYLLKHPLGWRYDFKVVVACEHEQLSVKEILRCDQSARVVNLA